VKFRRGVAFTLASVILIGCSGSSAPEATPTTTLAPTTSTTKPLPFVSNFDYLIAPNAADHPLIPDLRSGIELIEPRYPVDPDTSIIVYTPDEADIEWAMATAKSRRCFQDYDAEALRWMTATARACGLLIQIDRYGKCDDKTRCGATQMAIHEYAHLLRANQLGNTSDVLTDAYRDIPAWIHEADAEYFDYAFTFGSIPGRLTQRDIADLRERLKTYAQDPRLPASLLEMSIVWQQHYPDGPPSWFAYLYDRAFLAFTWLIERFGEQPTLTDYFANVVTTGSHHEAFESTFGITEDVFDKEFQAWIDAL
jgi:hypothetical protein